MPGTSHRQGVRHDANRKPAAPARRPPPGLPGAAEPTAAADATQADAARPEPLMMACLEDRVAARIEAGDRRPVRTILADEAARHAAPGTRPSTRSCPAAAAVATALREVGRLHATALRQRDDAAAARFATALDAIEHAAAAIGPAGPARRRVPAGLLVGRWSGGAR